ncbi:hypothetical protein COLO4_33420 [Corchorus olitorius]|uniref:Uncharacterized protein n=1 Tax=Corchorus olitorius TaxID=93759 RepID=A0A1R3GTR1_9ROSI|nr:hypothetical protein COLO4_33420 [Corchorus olitorius]
MATASELRSEVSFLKNEPKMPPTALTRTGFPFSDLPPQPSDAAGFEIIVNCFCTWEVRRAGIDEFCCLTCRRVIELDQSSLSLEATEISAAGELFSCSLTLTY